MGVNQVNVRIAAALAPALGEIVQVRIVTFELAPSYNL